MVIKNPYQAQLIPFSCRKVTRVEGSNMEIVVGATYAYINAIPKGCAGHHYKVHRFVLDVPSYQQKVLVEALSGHDKGLWFTCSPQNFSIRYRQVAEGEQPPAVNPEAPILPQG